MAMSRAYLKQKEGQVKIRKNVDRKASKCRRIRFFSFFFFFFFFPAFFFLFLFLFSLSLSLSHKTLFRYNTHEKLVNFMAPVMGEEGEEGEEGGSIPRGLYNQLFR